MTLVNCKPGKTYVVEAISLALPVKRRLEILGMTKGVNVVLLRKKKYGAVIVNIRGVRYAAGRKIASGIHVKEAEADKSKS